MKFVYKFFFFISIFQSVQLLKLTRIDESFLQKSNDQQQDIQDLIDNYVNTKQIRFLENDKIDKRKNKAKQFDDDIIKKDKNVIQFGDKMMKIDNDIQQKELKWHQKKQNDQIEDFDIEKEQVLNKKNNKIQSQYLNEEQSELNNVFRESVLNEQKTMTVQKDTNTKYDILGQMNGVKKREVVVEDEGGDEEMKVIKEGWLMVDPVYNIDSTKKQAQVPDFIKPKYEQQMNNPRRQLQINYRYNEEQKEIPDGLTLYFRLSKNNLYYTSQREDLVVLGAIGIKNIIELEKEEQYCFVVNDSEVDQWELCSIFELIDNGSISRERREYDSKRSWMCAIWKVIGQEHKCQQLPVVVEEREIVKQPVMVLLESTPECNQNWNYDQQGDDWECACKDPLQSPIDLPLPGDCHKEDNLEKLKVSAVFRFKEVEWSELEMRWEGNILKIVGKGGKGRCGGEGEEKQVVLMRVVDIDMQVYEVYEVGIHVEGEHTVGGERYPLEVEAQGISEDMLQTLSLSWRGKMDISSIDSDFFDNWDLLNLPDVDQPVKTFQGDKQPFNLKRLLVLDGQEGIDSDDNYYDYYTYIGSTTSPPCTTHSNWILFIDTFKVTFTLLEMLKNSQFLFRESSSSKQKYYSSHRSIQDKQERIIGIYLNKEKEESGMEGHFEKVEREVDNYFYQPGKLPSGFKDSSKIDYKDLYQQVSVGKKMKSLIKKAAH